MHFGREPTYATATDAVLGLPVSRRQCPILCTLSLGGPRRTVWHHVREEMRGEIKAGEKERMRQELDEESLRSELQAELEEAVWQGLHEEMREDVAAELRHPHVPAGRCMGALTRAAGCDSDAPPSAAHVPRACAMYRRCLLVP